MRKNRSWFVWCIVVALALLALAVPWLQVQGQTPGKKETYKGPCRVVVPLTANTYEITAIDAQIQLTKDAAGVLTQVTCRGKLDTVNRDLLPVSYNGDVVLMECDIIGGFNWDETINNGGMVTLTCYPGN